jgi:hypothetical protein
MKLKGGEAFLNCSVYLYYLLDDGIEKYGQLLLFLGKLPGYTSNGCLIV